MAKTDERIKTWEFDVETDQKVNQKLADMGINKIEDLGPGRGVVDAGSAANHLKGIDPAVSPLTAEKIIRDAQFDEMAGNPVQPTIEDTAQKEPAPPPPQDREATLTAELAAAKAEADDWKRKYGERENRLGDERRRTAERLARLEGGTSGAGGTVQTPQPQQPVSTGFTPAYQYDPRILGGRDPDTPMTGGEVAALMQSLASAFGAQLSARETQLLETTKQLRNYDLTADEEVSLIERHAWLANLDRGAQMSAMRDLAPTLRTQTNATNSGGAATPAAPVIPPVPQRQNMEALARARVRTATTYIEPSTQGSPNESSAAGEDNSALAKKAARLKELLATPGGTASGEAERLMNELSGVRR
jgi:hypothetical protein